MSSIQDLDKLSFKKIFIFILTITSLICPGILIILFFAPSLIMSISAVKLVILAISFTAPVYLFNSIIIGAFKGDFLKSIFISHTDDADKEFLSTAIIYVCSIYTMAIILTSLIAACLNSWDWRAFLKFVIGLQAIMGVALGIILKRFFKYSIFNKEE